MNGKDLLRKEDALGNVIHYGRGNQNKLYSEDTKGNKIYYRDDGETKWYTENSKGDKIYLKDDGETPDYAIIDGKKIPYKAPKKPSKAMRLVRKSRLALKRMVQTAR